MRKNFLTSQLAKIIHLSLRAIVKQSSFFYFSGLPRFARNDGKTTSLITTTNHKAKGFTLVELAIVIVIIGALLGGVLQGQELIKQAKTRGIIKEYEELYTAYNMYFTKYNAIPGDHSKAISMLGASYEGNGDRKVNIADENIYAFHHLSKAKLIRGQFDGIIPSGNLANLGINIPRSDYEASNGFWIYYRQGSPYYQKYQDINILWYGSNRLDVTRLYNGAVASIVANNIDRKIDDGKADSGLLIFGNNVDNLGNLMNCTTPWANIYSTTTGTPNFNIDTPECILIFLLPQY
jgi:prepilin-type N-terminal cleavage/methylation domain-containing protein